MNNRLSKNSTEVGRVILNAPRRLINRLLLLLAPLAFCAPLHAQSTTGIYVNSNNNVGIGTTNPAGILEVSKASPAIYFTDTGTSYVQLALRNGNSAFYLGQESAAGGTMLSGSSAYAGILNMANANPLQFGTGNAVRMTISSAGNVGIGTTTPSRPLEVAGQIYSNVAGGGSLALNGNNANSQPSIYFQRNNSSGWSAGLTSDTNASFYINNSYGGGNVMMMSPSGNVGIGTTSPATKLAVAGDAALNGSGHAYFFINGSSGDSEELWQENGANRWALGMNVGDGTENFNLYNYTTGITELSVNKTTGYVGIGTGSPGYMLDVAGRVHADSFVSYTQTYADFVFKPGYKLEPLSDVETAIKKDGHLPGIPSEAEAKAHGIDLASMQVKLLQKIEELTLHQIEQEKHQIEQDEHQIEQEKKLSAQESKLSAQAQRIEKLEKENAELRERVAK